MNKEEFKLKELDILRKAVDKAIEIQGQEFIHSSLVSKIIKIVEDFIKSKKCICYGGTAINNILPKKDQFYDYSKEIPDYDFFTSNAFNDAKELADIYKREGFDEVEAKSGMHPGTFKVFVNFIPVADLTQLDKEIFNQIKKSSIKRDGILYAPANFLRMSMYLELSRPAGDLSRWEKVLKRLILLNKNYPIKGKNCNSYLKKNEININQDDKEIFEIIKNSFIKQGLVFFGTYANSLYLKYLPRKENNKINIPDFDVLSENPLESAIIVKNLLLEKGFTNIKILKIKEIGEIIPLHYEININGNTVAYIYKPIACHSYNIIKIDNKSIKIATIDTMLSFYLAFLYTDRYYYDNNRILCMAQLLFQVQAKNRLAQIGLLKRFSTQCYGKQKSLYDIKADKAKIFNKLKNNKKSQKYQYNFLKYLPKKSKTQKKKK